jgi:Phosphotransferase enzyme family
VDIFQDEAAEVVVKRARSREERAQLAAEASVLRSLAHPGVVRLVDVVGGDPPCALRLRRIPGGDLSQLGAQPPEVVAGLGAAIATTVADLHDLGVEHGGVEASHVLLDGEGRPILCSFGRARSESSLPPFGLDRDPDVCALARLLLALLGSQASRRLDRTLRRAAAARGRGHGDARLFARQLTTCIPEARLPGGPDSMVETVSSGPGAPVQTRWRPDRFGPSPAWRRRVAAMVLAGSGVAAVAIYAATSRSASVSEWSVACPTVDDGCRPVLVPGGVLTTSGGRYAVAEAGDVVVLGRWQCGLPALPAVLRPRSGQLWAFAAWPKPGHGVTGQLVASQVRGATSLRVVAERSGCDRIEVERLGQPAITMAVPR